ncbi:MAG: hypothetical protein FJZ97_13255 [Chloroflexi bacterium]|nr:hypothetical protein [Chloroflexota bacterium]
MLDKAGLRSESRPSASQAGELLSDHNSLLSRRSSMFSSPVFYAWLVWLLALAAFAVSRHKGRQREEQQREERRQQREAERAERGQHSGSAMRPRLPRPPLPADYRDQLIAAGIIRPAAEPDISPDPATSM